MGYGIVMFIDMQVMLMDDWRDEVVELVDAKYPFKALLLEKINIKPMAVGEVLMLPANGSVIICVFSNFGNSDEKFHVWLKKAFSAIRDRTAGNVRLAVQTNTTLPDYIRDKAETLLVCTFKSVFRQHLREDILRATLFLCGRQPTNRNP
ncbi:uncharacterized protein LOC126840624 [Adelges cooleyi]|uniref:uncharacterized protein LOC126840624 n=1 Tax=Adelges cooleyi TaxID=133065 RepID=UPI00217F64F9|nr:uncharacterized protein LOC126840624 [Adelges cooleyi]